MTTNRSRYRSDSDPQPIRNQTGPDGDLISYLPRRLLPLPEQIMSQAVYVVQPGDRIDLVAYQLLGDPLLDWLIADANGAIDPAALCEVPGRRLRVPAPLALAPDSLDQPPPPAPGAASGPVDDDTEG